MGLANTLSVLLSFKTDLSGLDKFMGAVQSRLQQVQEFNAKVSNGAAAVNNALQAAAGVFAVSQLREYSREALQARAAQGQLAQALKSQKQDSAAYRAELSAQASALQRRTGVEDEVIAGVQRQLVFAKAQRQDIAELTALTLDFAAAKEIDGVSAAKAVGRALQGEGDELKRYGVEVDLAADKVSALKAGLGKFRGQAATAFETLPEGMREFKVAAKEAEQSAGEAILGFTAPFLNGVATGLRGVKDALDEVGSSSSMVSRAVDYLVKALGAFVGSNLTRILALVAALLALKGSSYAANEAIKMLAAGFMVITRQNLAATIAGVQSLSKEVGILQGLSIGGWPAKLAVGLLAIAAAFTGYQAGKGIKLALAQAEADARVSAAQSDADATKTAGALLEQLTTIKQITEAKQIQEKLDEALRKNTEERQKLEAKKEKADSPSTSMFQASQIISMDERKRLEFLQKEVRELALAYLTATDPKTIEGLIQKNVQVDAEKAVKLTPEQLAAKAELELKRQLFDLDTAIKEAELDHNDALADRLTRERDEFALLQQLGPAGYEIIQARLAAEDEERKKQRAREQTERDIFALETQATEAEAVGNTKLAEQIRSQAKAKQLALEDERRSAAEIQKRVDAERAVTDEQRRRQVAEQNFSRDIALKEQAAAAIEQSKYLTQQEKDAARILLLKQTNELIAARIVLLEKEQQLSPDPTRQKQIDDLRQKQGANTNEAEQLRPQSVGEGVLQGVRGQGGFLDSLGTMAQNAATAVSGTLNTALQATGDLLFNIATGAMNFRQAWGQATLAVGQMFVRMATEMVAKMIWRATIERALIAFGVTSHVAGEATKTAATTAGSGIRLGATLREALADVYHGAVAAFKALASIPYVGPILGAAAMAAALAGGLALVHKIGGHEQGGIVRGGKQLTWINEAGEEAVIRAPAVQKFGERFLTDLNAGVLNLSALPSSVAAQIPGASSGGSSATVDGGVAPGASGSQRINVFVHTDESIGRAWLERQSGRKILYRQLNQDRRELGMES